MISPTASAEQSRSHQPIRPSLPALAVGTFLALGMSSACEDIADLQAPPPACTGDVVECVWRATWGALDLGEPPTVIIDEGVDPRCDARRFWAEDHHACIVGVFLKDTFTVRLGRESPLLLGQELAHSALWRMWQRWGGDLLTWSEGHTREYWLHACRAERQHAKILGHDINDQGCNAVNEQLDREEKGR